MRDVSLWRYLLGVEKTVVERVEFDEDAELLVLHVRPTSSRPDSSAPDPSSRLASQLLPARPEAVPPARPIIDPPTVVTAMELALPIALELAGADDTGRR